MNAVPMVRKECTEEPWNLLPKTQEVPTIMGSCPKDAEANPTDLPSHYRGTICHQETKMFKQLS